MAEVERQAEAPEAPEEPEAKVRTRVVDQFGRPVAARDVPHPAGVMTAQKVHQDPPMYIIQDFASPEECKHLIELCEDRWQRSTVTRGKAAGLYGAKKNGLDVTERGVDADGNEIKPLEVVNTIGDSRTSFSVHLDPLESDVVFRIMARVANLCQVSFGQVEDFHVVRYYEGQFFKLHHDGAMRPKTVFLYLSGCESGGGTEFPQLGLTINPMAGLAVMWPNVLGEGDEAVADTRMEHQALPPGPGAVKYGMNCFVNRSIVNTEVVDVKATSVGGS